MCRPGVHRVESRKGRWPPTAVVGGDGLVGRHLLAAVRRQHATAPGTSRRATRSADLALLDLAHPDLSAVALGDVDNVVIAAAVCRVDACEEDPTASARVNVHGTLALVEQIWQRDRLPVFLSSDYVFDGLQPRGYTEADAARPQTAYGRQKRAVEEALAADGRPYLVLRLSKVFGVAPGDGTLLDEMAVALQAGRPVKAAWDQVFCPTPIDELVEATRRVLAMGLRGVVHVCGETRSRYDLAVAWARALGFGSDRVLRVSLADLGLRADRPTHTNLATERLHAETGYRFSSLDDTLAGLAGAWRRDG